jgi:AraC-like DNA-binding protein
MVVDPYAEQTNRAEEMASWLRRFPSMPVIAYTQFIPAALKALTLLAQYGLRETILFQVDDSRSRISRLIVQASTHSLVTRMLHELREGRSRLPTLLADTVDDLFRRPHAYTSARDLVRASQVPLTSLYRAITEAGLGSPKQLFIAARVLHAVWYLRDPGYTVEQVAEKTGYLHPRVLTQHTLAIFKARPSTLREISEDELLSGLARWTICEEKVLQARNAAAAAQGEAKRPGRMVWRGPSFDRIDIANEVASESDFEIVWGSLLGYGAYLESSGQLQFAACVYQLMINAMDLSGGCNDPLVMAGTLAQYGAVLRLLQNFDASSNAYQRALDLAEQEESIQLALQVRAGMAETLQAKQNSRHSSY